MNIVVVQDDISQVAADAIVSPTNTALLDDGCIGSLLVLRGGESVRDALRQRASLPLGGVADTPAGALAARHLLHVAVVGLRAEELAGARFANALSTPSTLFEAMTNALEAATALRCETLAVPMLGAGLAMVPSHLCAAAMVRAVRDYADVFADSTLREVRLVAMADDELAAFREALS